MIKKYNDTEFSGLFNYNDPKIAEIANNLFEKIRQFGELAGYIKRDKIVREKFNVVDGSAAAPIGIKDDKFTFGYAYCGKLLTVEGDSRYDNLGRVYTIEFEISFNEPIFGDIDMFDSKLLIRPDGTITFHGLEFLTTFELYKLYKIKIIRDHYDVSLYIDNVLLGTDILSEDIDTEYNILYVSGPSTPPVTVYFDVNVSSLAPNSGVSISVNKIDKNGQSHGITSFTRTYIDGESVLITAPSVSNTGTVFKLWRLDSVDQTEGEVGILVTMDQDHDVIAVYEEEVVVTGTIQINKVVSNALTDKHIFRVKVNGVSYSIVQGTPLLLTNMSLGNYVVTEDTEEWYDLDSIVPSSFTLDEDTLSVSVVVTNIKKESVPTLGSIVINKSVGEVPVSQHDVFEYTVTGSGPTPLIVTKSGTMDEHPIVFNDLPEDTYVITESPMENYVLVSITPDTCVISEGGTLDWEVDVVNEPTPITDGGYGLIYNNYAIQDSRNIAPLMTRVATDDDWTELSTYLGGITAAGPKLKTTYDWPTNPGTNSSGFSARPAGYRSSDGVYHQFQSEGLWWTDTQYSYDRSWYRKLSDSLVSLVRSYEYNKVGMSVRFLIDMSLFSQSNPPPSQITDYDGNVYDIIVIGEQRWATTNLKVKHYRNGDSISFVDSNSIWGHLSTGAWCYPNGDENNI